MKLLGIGVFSLVFVVFCPGTHSRGMFVAR